MASLSIIETSTTTNNLAHSQSKARKGKKNIVVQEQQLCCSFLHISQDSMIENGQKSTTFWDWVHNHFNESHLTSCAPRYARSLETKWGIIQHDVAKFIKHYIAMIIFCESGIGTKDTL